MDVKTLRKPQALACDWLLDVFASQVALTCVTDEVTDGVHLNGCRAVSHDFKVTLITHEVVSIFMVWMNECNTTHEGIFVDGEVE